MSPHAPFLIKQTMEKRYKKQYAAIWREADRLNPSASSDMHNQFTFFSANLEHFLPPIPVGRHLELFREAVAYERLNRLDLPFAIEGYVPTLTGWDVARVEGLKRKPGIIACAHAGAHLLIGWLLARAGVPVALLAAGHSAKRLQLLWRSAARRHPALALPHIINASSRTALRQLIGHAKAGSSLLIYWDGEEGGGGGANKTDHRIQVPLLGQHLLLRKGIAFLAGKTGMPIYPTTAFRQKDGSVRICQSPEIEVSGGCVQEQVGYMMQSITAHFSSQLIHFPTQWNRWPHIHRQVRSSGCFIESGRLLSARFGILKVPEGYCLLEKANYRAVALSEKDLDAIGQLRTNC